MTRTPTDVSVELFERVRALMTEKQIVELTVAIAQENFRARFNRPFDVQAAGFSEGAYCPLPERSLEK
jgi:alkylhydroperoxidase family enzyme